MLVWLIMNVSVAIWFSIDIMTNDECLRPCKVYIIYLRTSLINIFCTPLCLPVRLSVCLSFPNVLTPQLLLIIHKLYSMHCLIHIDPPITGVPFPWGLLLISIYTPWSPFGFVLAIWSDFSANHLLRLVHSQQYINRDRCIFFKYFFVYWTVCICQHSPFCTFLVCSPSCFACMQLRHAVQFVFWCVLMLSSEEKFHNNIAVQPPLPLPNTSPPKLKYILSLLYKPVLSLSLSPFSLSLPIPSSSIVMYCSCLHAKYRQHMHRWSL